LNTLIVMYFSN